MVTVKFAIPNAPPVYGVVTDDRGTPNSVMITQLIETKLYHIRYRLYSHFPVEGFKMWRDSEKNTSHK